MSMLYTVNLSCFLVMSFLLTVYHATCHGLHLDWQCAIYFLTSPSTLLWVNMFIVVYCRSSNKIPCHERTLVWLIYTCSDCRQELYKFSSHSPCGKTPPRIFVNTKKDWGDKFWIPCLDTNLSVLSHLCTHLYFVAEIPIFL